MMQRRLIVSLAGGLMLIAATAVGQEAPQGRRAASPQQRAEATRQFLGLGPAPNKEEAAQGAPIFQQNCSFCHGPQARGAEGPSLITSALVLDDVHGDKLLSFLKTGRPAQGMPSFGSMSDEQLTDVIEFIHQQVEDVANRGTYTVKNILVGNAADGKTYVADHCMSCHQAGDFEHLAAKYRTPADLQRTWVWPERPGDPATAITATVKLPDGGTVEGQLKEISDFKVTLLDSAGQTHVIDRQPGVNVQVHDPLAAHEKLIMTLKNDDLHNVTAYLETLK